VQDTLDETDETMGLLLSAPSANVTPGDMAGTGTITDNDNPPTVSVNSPAAVTEGSNITFTVSLSTASGLPITVARTTSGGTAIAGSDYTATTGTATVVAGSTSTTFTVQTTDDSLDEPNGETIGVVLSSPSNATLGTSNGTGAINDNDNGPVITVANAAGVE